MIEIDKNFAKDVLDFIKEVDAEKDSKDNETYIHRGMRIAIETGKYTGYEIEDKDK